MVSALEEKTMNDTQTLRLTKIDWRWLVVTYCFLVLFHLLPPLLELTLWEFLHSLGIWRFVVWTGGGIALVSAYVGSRSIGITILEPGIASMLYMATLIHTMSRMREVHATGYRLIGLLVALHLIAFLVGCLGAAAGEWLQVRRARAQGLSENP
jgi:hypothetical protein